MKNSFLANGKSILFYLVKILSVTAVYTLLWYLFEFKGHLKDPISFLICLPLNHFIGSGGWKYVGWHLRIKKAIYWVIYWFIALSYIPGKIIDWFFPENIIADMLLYLDSYWFTSMKYFLVILVLFIPVGFIIKKAGKPENKVTNFLQNTPTIGLVLLIAIISYFSYGTWNARNTVITRYDISIDKKVGNLRSLNVVMLSDIHLGRVINNKRLISLVEEINRLKPDIVLLAGDCIEDEYEPYIRQNMARTLQKINSKLGVYAVLGNHDIAMGNTEINIKNLNNARVIVLKDQYIKVADAFYIVGRSDRGEVGENSGRPKISDIVKGIDKSLPIILMDHQPVDFDLAEENGVDVQLSGHTHNGQDIFGRFFTSLSYELAYGISKHNSFNAIVSSGFGTWGSPVRVGTSSEIVNIHINFKCEG